MTALRVIPPADYIGAVEAMDEVTAAVQELLDAGAAYRVTDEQYPDVYFDVTASGHFGYESRYDEPTMLRLSAERGGDPDRPGKRQRLDPLLWRMERPGEPAWTSPMGRGRPGWHIECAVIAGNRIGPVIDRAGRWQRPDLPAPRVLRRPRRGAVRQVGRSPGTTCTPA